MVWKQFVFFGVTNEVRCDDPFNKLRKEAKVRDGSV